MEHKNINDFFYKRGMKAISIILSGTTLLGVATGITAYSLANRKNKKDVLPTSPTSASTTTPDNKQETELLVLADDFSATELDKVAKRAKDIFELSEEEYTELDIANMIYKTTNANSKKKEKYMPPSVKNNNSGFSPRVNDTLDQMRKNY